MFKVLSNEWCESRRRDHVEKFRNYHPTNGNDLHKPRNAVRKPCYIHRKKAKEPGIAVDRHISGQLHHQPWRQLQS